MVGRAPATAEHTTLPPPDPQSDLQTPQAHHAAGRALAAAGRLDEALAAFDRALALAPAFPMALHERGVVRLRQGDPVGALADVEAAIRLKPAWADARLTRGVVLRRLGRQDAAIAAYDALIAEDPKNAAALYNRGHVQRDLGRLAAAAADFRAAIAERPEWADAHNTLGDTLLKLRKPAEALEALDAALRLQPDHAGAHHNRGLALLALGRPEAALESFGRAIAIDPRSADALAGRGMAQAELQQPQAALESLDEALRLRPGDAGLLTSRADALLRLGRPQAALESAQQAIAADPQLAPAYLNRALARLTLGDFADGWDDYERRWDADPGAVDPLASVPPPIRARFDRGVTGDDLVDARVLLAGEQGVGDAIMFASMVPDVLAVADRVALTCEPRLRRLFAASFPSVEVLPAAPGAEALGRFDRVLPLGSLGRLYRRSREAFPGRPYLAPSPEARDRWAARLAQRGAALRVGLSWRGGGPRTGGARRSLEIAQLRPLLELADCEFVSLQYGDVQAELQAISGSLAPPIRSFPAPETEDFEDLAGLVQSLDVIVSVQTSLVHLAGALGAPCLVMVPRAPEWRYAAAGSAMPWYRSVRLFRQDADGDWAPVVEAVRQALQAAAQARRSR